jgi:hypothetical protein
VYERQKERERGEKKDTGMEVKQSNKKFPFKYIFVT